MNNRQLRRALCIPALLCTLCMARGADPSDLFLLAYQDFEAAEKLEVNGSNSDALAKYKEAEQLLGQVKQASADWQPLVVAYRLKKTEESIQRLQVQGAASGANSATASSGDNSNPAPAMDTGSQQGAPAVNSDPLSVAAEQGPARTTLAPASPAGDDNLTVGSNIVLERELIALRKQLNTVKRQNASLNDKLLNQSAQIQSARVELDRTKVDGVQLKSDLGQVKDAYNNLLKDGKNSEGLLAAYQTRIRELQSAVDDSEADKAVLTDENNHLYAQLDKASAYIKKSDTIRTGLETDRDTLAGERDKAVAKAKHVKDNTAQIQRVTEENGKLKDQDADLKKQMADMKKNAVSRDDYNKLEAQNDQLTSQNKDLNDQLVSAKKLAGNSEADQKRIAQLQSDLDGTKDKLLEAQADVSKREQRVDQLMKQLDQTSGELAALKLNPSPSADDRKVISENELLRDIVLRQIKEQARREQAGKEVEQQVQALKINADSFHQQLAILEEPILKLTPEEKALFKEPVTLLQDSKSSSMEITTAISKPSGSPGASPAPAHSPAAVSQDVLPDSVKPLVQKASEAFTKGDYTQAEKTYQSIVDAAPDSYFALSNLGAVQIQSGKLTAAEIALKKAISVSPDDYFAWLNLGIVYCKQGKFDEAIDTLNHAIKLKDSNSVAHNYLGICEGEKGDKTTAEKEFKRAVELNPGYGEAHFNLAVLYATAQPPSLQEAKEHYAKAMSLGAAPDPSLEALINKS